MRVPAPLFIPSPTTALFKNPNLPLFGRLSGLELTTCLQPSHDPKQVFGPDSSVVHFQQSDESRIQTHNAHDLFNIAKCHLRTCSVNLMG